MCRNGLLLNEQTEDFIYNPTHKYGYLAKPYKKGTRQILEGYIDRVCTPGMSDADKIVALAQSMEGPLQQMHPKGPNFLYGESDEQTILKGGGHCSCRGRLLSALAQVLGLQGRPALMWLFVDKDKNGEEVRLGGHTVAEVLIDGKWGFFDPQHHLYCRTHDGSFCSIGDIRRNPKLLTDMPKTIVDEMQPIGYGEWQEKAGMGTFEYYLYKNFGPKCPTMISRHDVNDPYEGQWNFASKEFFDNLNKEHAQLRPILRAMAERGELTAEVYRMNLTQFRKHAGITTTYVNSLAGDMSWEPVPTPRKPKAVASAA
jgi:hypothetical protein